MVSVLSHVKIVESSHQCLDNNPVLFGLVPVLRDRFGNLLGI